jgi:PTH1 family peptidyl-tRNA hydrolase
MKLFVGLGNPGAKYAQNRHNIGFMALDRIAEDHGFSPWRNKFQGQFCEGKLGDSKVLLLKPTTFMNRSGQSVGEATRFHKMRMDRTQATMACVRSMRIWATIMPACAWESDIPAIRMP